MNKHEACSTKDEAHMSMSTNRSVKYKTESKTQPNMRSVGKNRHAENQIDPL